VRAFIVTDLGFGDCGKGLLTDFLVRRFDAGLVVRYNGGAQAGHNVVTPDGRHHTFSQFGSGMFVPGVKTWLSKDVVIHPNALLVEGDILEKKGVSNPFSRLCVSDQALVITPFHQAANRLREIARGADRHGSCGVGVGEAVEDALLRPEYRVLAGDLDNPTLLRHKLRTIREQKCAELAIFRKDQASNPIFIHEYEIFEREDIIDRWIASVARIVEIGLIAPDGLLEHWLRETDHAIFEGAQGVLLDADAGFHPFTTWSRCTATNAFEIIRQMAPSADVCQIGVMRCYAVRHGPGPLPTETGDMAALVAEHNQTNPWQGTVRYGWFDAVLARYALDVASNVDTLLVTHMDMLSKLETWKHCVGYQREYGFNGQIVDMDESNGILTNFRLPHALPLKQREQFSHALSAATPLVNTCKADAATVIQKIEALVGHSVGLVSHGPSAKNVEILDTTF
jgi:adenylosuccinate synthase